MLKNKKLIGTSILTLTCALLLSGCAKEDKGLNANPGDANNLVDNGATTVESGFGADIKLGSDLTVSFAENVSFIPGTYASNYQKGQVPNKFEITITNGGSTALDLSTIAISAKSAKEVCVDVLDGDNGITGAPLVPVAAGKSVSFTYGIGCNAKVGDPLELSATIAADVVAVTGTLK